MDKSNMILNRSATKARFLKNCIMDEEEIIEDSSSEQWTTKSAILFPINLLWSQSIIDMCRMTGVDYYHLADKDTPSTYSGLDCPNEVRNSTQIDESDNPSLKLHLSNIIAESAHDDAELLGDLEMSESAQEDALGLMSGTDLGALEEIVLNSVDDLSFNIPFDRLSGHSESHVLESEPTKGDPVFGNEERVIGESLQECTSSSNCSSNTSSFGDEETFIPSLRCKECGRKFKSISGKSRHTCNPDSFYGHVCSKCEDSFASMGGLKKHILFKHTRPKAKIHQCDECDDVFTNRKSLTKHRLDHHSSISSDHDIDIPQKTG